MGNVQEREEWDYQAGAASDAQNAYTLSGMERRPDDSAAIDAAIARGAFVVVTVHTVYCRSTDAILGSDYMIDSEHATHAAAHARGAVLWNELGAAAGDINVIVRPDAARPTTKAAAAPIDDDELPF
jgi:microcompartment protein CcmK/EutM